MTLAAMLASHHKTKIGISNYIVGRLKLLRTLISEPTTSKSAQVNANTEREKQEEN